MVLLLKMTFLTFYYIRDNNQWYFVKNVLDTKKIIQFEGGL